MKTKSIPFRNSKFEIRIFPFLAALLAPAAIHAQDAAGDAAIIEVLMKNHSELMPMLQKQLEEAEKQASNLEKQLQRMGDPSAVNPEAIAMIKQDVKRSAGVLKTMQEKRQVYESLTGAEVFDADADGLLEAIGSTYKNEDGVEVERDPERYKLEAAFMTQIKEYKQIREQAIEQQKLLAEELAIVMEELEAAQDFATVQKLNATINVINSQIDDWNQKVMMARADVDMVEKEYQSTARVVNEGRNEQSGIGKPAVMSTDEIKSKIEGLNFGKSSTGRLPWGRKGGQSAGEAP